MNTRLATMCVTLPLIAMLMPDVVHAQLLSRYLPQSVPGYEQDPMQTVIQGTGTDYTPIAWRVDDFVIRPVIDETVGWDQNPLGLTDGKSSLKVESGANVSANSDWSHDSFGVSLSFDDLEFPNLPIANERTDTAFAGGRINLGRDSLDLSAGHIDSDLGPTSVLTQGLSAPVPYQQNDIRAAYNWLFNRLTVSPNIDFSTYRFGTAPATAGVVDDSGLGKNQIIGGANASYDFSQGSSLVVVWQDAVASFVHRLRGEPNPDYLDTLVLGGLDYDTRALFRYDFLVGYERRSFGSSAISTLSVPVVEASITYLPSLLTTIKAVAIRHLSDAGYNVAENLAYTEGVLRVDHALRRNILLNARVDAAYTDASATNFSHLQLTAGVGATWVLSRRVTIGLDYTFSHGSSAGNNGEPYLVQTGTLQNGAVDNNYSASAVSLSMHMQL